jgi:hypothetical protein
LVLSLPARQSLPGQCSSGHRLRFYAGLGLGLGGELAQCLVVGRDLSEEAAGRRGGRRVVGQVSLIRRRSTASNVTVRFKVLTWEPPIGIEPMTYALRVRRSDRLS